MSKSLFFRLFGLGAIPKKARPILESEEILVADEGITGRFIGRNVKGPGRRYIGKIKVFLGCLIITKKRIVCYGYNKRQIHIEIDDPKLSNLYVDMPGTRTLSISFESSLFQQGWEGVIEFRFKTDKAGQFQDLLRSLGAQQGHAGKG